VEPHPSTHFDHSLASALHDTDSWRFSHQCMNRSFDSDFQSIGAIRLNSFAFHAPALFSVSSVCLAPLPRLTQSGGRITCIRDSCVHQGRQSEVIGDNNSPGGCGAGCLPHLGVVLSTRTAAKVVGVA
jgi:hypothetical protein